MRFLLALALVFVCACSDRSPEADARRATEAHPTPTDTALTGTFGGTDPGGAAGTSATSGTHPGATGTDASTLTDPNVSTTGAPPNRTST